MKGNFLFLFIAVSPAPRTLPGASKVLNTPIGWIRNAYLYPLIFIRLLPTYPSRPNKHLSFSPLVWSPISILWNGYFHHCTDHITLHASLTVDPGREGPPRCLCPVSQGGGSEPDPWWALRSWLLSEPGTGEQGKGTGRRWIRSGSLRVLVRLWRKGNPCALSVGM